ncbi:MAG: hypothetical protein QNJ72_14475 [Pleurocapsa sp. MO_226.B13]|nr:hypothetical protein [Pleurocapsa sp. MO_226.B13]
MSTSKQFDKDNLPIHYGDRITHLSFRGWLVVWCGFALAGVLSLASSGSSLSLSCASFFVSSLGVRPPFLVSIPLRLTATRGLTAFFGDRGFYKKPVSP